MGQREPYPPCMLILGQTLALSRAGLPLLQLPVNRPGKQKSCRRMLFTLLLPSWQFIHMGHAVRPLGLTCSWAFSWSHSSPGLWEGQRGQRCWQCPWRGQSQQGLGPRQQPGHLHSSEAAGHSQDPPTGHSRELCAWDMKCLGHK